MDNIIEIRNLVVRFPLHMGTIYAVNHVDLDIPRGSITALVGESGSGKSTIAAALLSMVSNPGIIDTCSSVLFNGENILKYKKEKLRQYKWKNVSMVFQAAQSCLNPVYNIGNQIIETYRDHGDKRSDTELFQEASQYLEQVRLEPDRIFKSYPHELSGGMKQRVMLAFALLLKPEVIILDEPTTALDVITQDFIFEILQQIHDDFKITFILLTHDIAVVAKFATRMGVMYAGTMVEVGDIFDIFTNPMHEYTHQLIDSAPSLMDDLQERHAITGSPPDLLRLPKGCYFSPRCEFSEPRCLEKQPEMVNMGNDHLVRCFRRMKNQERG